MTFDLFRRYWEQRVILFFSNFHFSPLTVSKRVCEHFLKILIKFLQNKTQTTSLEYIGSLTIPIHYYSYSYYSLNILFIKFKPNLKKTIFYHYFNFYKAVSSLITTSYNLDQLALKNNIIPKYNQFCQNASAMHKLSSSVV